MLNDADVSKDVRKVTQCMLWCPARVCAAAAARWCSAGWWCLQPQEPGDAALCAGSAQCAEAGHQPPVDAVPEEQGLPDFQADAGVCNCCQPMLAICSSSPDDLGCLCKPYMFIS
jgi:hypothetical protein